MFGVLNVYKPVGMTSHDVVGRLRRVTKIKQIGHTGTLDPLAEGVLLICIGKATKLIEFFDDEKSYCAYAKLGESTTTYDVEGEVTFSSEKVVSENECMEAVKLFKGEILQVPPMYSAIKKNGKKLYEYAREGKSVDIEPRKVTINSIELEKFDIDNKIAKINIDCSKGTYIRSLVHDLGENLGTGAHLIKLVRTKVGAFNVDKAIDLDELDSLEKVKENLISPLEILNLPTYNLSEREHNRIIHGNWIKSNFKERVDFVILIYNNCISAIAKADDDKFIVKKVLE